MWARDLVEEQYGSTRSAHVRSRMWTARTSSSFSLGNLLPRFFLSRGMQISN
ncbi:hypothetical protein BT93_L5369 [Corymbia citriodora subsp. variegata]|uniref:Uncharacterized protein n=1 Tax=Corymbia citriodora subsp. variegata TaxID=360336 RepID=A0A8T0CXA5_CORYI|nr:hypothetical protein BT93_L5369 [Corymbia citriodora subsp. variegata]